MISRLLVSILLFSIILCQVKMGDCEIVFVKSSTDKQGHAWLFGSSGETANECWLAVPLHVIVDDNGNTLPFTYTDRSGVSGQSGHPISIQKVPGAVSSAGGTTDLAFAPIEAGRNKGGCLSRLGLPKFLYKGLMQRSPKLILTSMFPTSYGVFEGKIDRAGTLTDGGLIDVVPTDMKDTRDIRQGMSGSTVLIEYEGEIKPLGMVLQADPDKKAFRLLRFDLIKSAFEKVEAFYANQISAKPPKTEGIPYRVVGFTGISVDTAIGPGSLSNPDLCWKLMPPQGKNTVTVVIEMENPNDRVSSLVVHQSPECSKSPYEFFVDQRVPQVSSDWVRVRSCSSSESMDLHTTCAMDLKGPRQIRLTFIAKPSVGISFLIIY